MRLILNKLKNTKKSAIFVYAFVVFTLVIMPFGQLPVKSVDEFSSFDLAADACGGGVCLPQCGDGILDVGEQCDDGNLADGDGCSSQCLIELIDIPVTSCSGAGDLLVYQGDQTQDMDVYFTANNTEVLIFVKYTQSPLVKVNGVSVTPSLVAQKLTPFPVSVYSVSTNPGDSVYVYEDAPARAIQGYLMQDASNPVYDMSSLSVIYDDEQSNDMYLTPGDYSYLFFDKYTNYSHIFDLQGPDNRELIVDIDGPSGNFLHDVYTQPYPSAIQGVVVKDYTVTEEGMYSLSVDTEDSVYWFLNDCPAPPVCGDGSLDDGEQCDDGNLTAGDGCSAMCELEYASISGCKYNDEDGDGVLTGSESKLSGITIKLYTDPISAFYRETTTDNDGCYVFDQLDPGTYKIREEVSSPWVQTYPTTPYDGVSVDYLDNLTDYDFANYEETSPEVGTISGCKYEDVDNLGVIDAGEGTLSNWEIVLTYPDSSQVSTMTNANGCYAFENIPLGTYIVSEVNQSGWTQTFPGGDGTHTVNLNAPQTIANQDFANYEEPGPYCGDSTVNQPSEECDLGVDNGNICTPSYGQSCEYCSQSCTLITIDGPYCGDGNLDDGEECDEGQNNGSLTCSSECTIPVSGMDLKLTKTVDKSSVTVGNSVVFTITVENEGDQDASGVLVEDRLPNGLEFISYNVSAGYYSSDYGIWTIGDLAAGDLVTLNLVVKVNSASTFTNVAEVMEHNEDDVDSTPGNDVLSEDDQDQAEVTGTEPGCLVNCGGGGTPTEPYIVIVKTAGVAWTNPDTIVDYTISITNTGTALGTSLTLDDTLPAGLEYASSTIDGHWDLGNIDVNQTKTVQYQVRFPAGLEKGDYVNTAIADITNGNSAQDDATVEVRTTTVYSERFEPILAIDKVVDRTFTNPGGEAVYTVTVTNTNQGTLTAYNVNLVDRLPDKFVFAGSDKQTVESWSLGDMAPGESKSISFTVKVDKNAANGIYDNIATAYADNAPEVSDIEPLEVRSVLVQGYTLPDTNGSTNFFLSLVGGIMLILFGYLLRKYRQLQAIRI